MLAGEGEEDLVPGDGGAGHHVDGVEGDVGSEPRGQRRQREGLRAFRVEADVADGRAIAGEDLAPVKARLLLMLALTRTQSGAEIQRMFLEY